MAVLVNSLGNIGMLGKILGEQAPHGCHDKENRNHT